MRIAFGLMAVGVLWAGDADWPTFRGPEANPAVRNAKLPETWSKTQNVEWVAEIPGRGWSSPIVNGRDAFLTAVETEGKSKKPQIGTEYSNDYVAELQKQGLKGKEVMDRVTERDIELPSEVVVHYFLYSLDLETGRVNWKREFYGGRPPGGRHRKNSFSSETPVTDGKAIYVYAANLGLYAYDLKGAQLWHTALDAYPMYLDVGSGSSPALWGNLLVIVNDNQKQQFIAAFDKATGKQIWRRDRDLMVKGMAAQRTAWATPFVWNSGQRSEVVTVGPGMAVSYDADGKELWRLSGMAAAPIPMAFAYEGLLYVNGGKSGGLFAIRPGAKGDLTPREDGKAGEFIAWFKEHAGTYLSTEVAYEGALYTLSENGILSRFDSKTGELSYKARIEGGEAFTSSPWAYNGKIFCLSEEGTTFVIAAGGKFEQLRANALDEMALATPAIVGDRLLLRTEMRLYSIRQGN